MLSGLSGHPYIEHTQSVSSDEILEALKNAGST